MNDILVPVSLGELADKISILEIKAERIGDPDKRANVRRELDALQALWQRHQLDRPGVGELRDRLKRVNEALWEIEDRIRLKERAAAFDAEFIALARSVYFENDERARLKRELNLLLGSTLIEEKSYADYRGPSAPPRV